MWVNERAQKMGTKVKINKTKTTHEDNDTTETKKVVVGGWVKGWVK